MSLGGTFGSEKESSSGSQTSTQDTTTTEQLMLSDEAINSIISDILSAGGGLADIFSEANVAGIYDSTVATGATSDLLANIASEIAELTGEKVTTGTATSSAQTSGSTSSNSFGLTGSMGKK